MKSILTIFIYALIIVPTLCSAQVNFPESNAVWAMNRDRYFPIGDSINKQTKYLKFFKSTDTNLTTNSFYGLFREDTNSLKCWYIVANDTAEKLLYDFSLDSGDTATVYPETYAPNSNNIYYNPTRIVVHKIDSVIINGLSRKRLLIHGLDENTWYDEYWIEGIGSTYGLFSSGISGERIIDKFYDNLLCFSRNDTVVYQNPKHSTCYNPTLSKFENQKTTKFSLYPNPTANSIFIKGEKKIDLIIIRNSLGKIETLIHNYDLESELDLTSLSSGVYFLEIQYGTLSVYKKLIKSDY